MTEMLAINRILRAHLDQSEFEYGFADLRGLLGGRYARYSHGISILRPLEPRIVDGIEDGPTREYFDHYHAVNHELNEIVRQLVRALSELGLDCEAIAATALDSELDQQFRDRLAYPVSHKMVATRAGLGWIGKTDLLVSRRFGPRVRLASILTTEVLAAGAPLDDSECGDCAVCVEQCPARAANGAIWRAGDAREAYFDAFKCRDYCRKISLDRLGEHISLCGKCVKVCPLGSQ
jgi:epoxyqueuosine reductase QueG